MIVLNLAENWKHGVLPANSKHAISLEIGHALIIFGRASSRSFVREVKIFKRMSSLNGITMLSLSTQMLSFEYLKNCRKNSLELMIKKKNNNKTTLL